MERFRNRSVLVTGSTSGIGLATASRLAAEGARVIVAGSRPSPLEMARTTFDGKVHDLLNDAGDPEAAYDLVAGAE